MAATNDFLASFMSFGAELGWEIDPGNFFETGSNYANTEEDFRMDGWYKNLGGQRGGQAERL